VNALEAGFFSQVEVVGQGRRGTSGQRHVDGVAEAARVEAHHERHGRVLRCWTTVTAEAEIVLEHVSSFAMTGVAAALGAAEDWEHRVSLWSARNPWSGEHRWSGHTLGDLGLYDVGMTRYGQTGTKNRVALTSAGSWPSAELLPMGWPTGPGGTPAWQIEHNGSWHDDNTALPVVFNDFMNCLMGDPTTDRLLPPVLVDPLFPHGARAEWDAGAVRATLPGPHTACVVRLRPGIPLPRRDA